MRALISIVVAIVMALIAKKKGFNPWLWILGAGIPGFVILLFLPSANSENIDDETKQKRIRVGNKVGAILSVIAATILIGFLVYVESIRP